MGAPAIINLEQKFGSFADHWNPRIVGGYNGNELRLVKLQGDFTWHSHADTDELFFVVKGAIGIEFRDGTRRLTAGEMIVVPRGTEHRPFAESEAEVLLIDREGESNTGDTPSHRTREKLETL
ncbi:MAG: cupin domain-containing protein [Pseudomonadota bacterium]|jgi:mannose-6-phosphate isomerase-like protein (cupin superfamily)